MTMELNKNGDPYYVTGTELTYSRLKPMTKDELIEYLGVAQFNYESVNERLYSMSQYAEKLDKALDKACDFLEKSKFGTTCDGEYHKNCTENHCSTYCMYSRKMNKKEWRKYLLESVKE